MFGFGGCCTAAFAAGAAADLDQLVGPAAQNGDGVAHVLDAGDLHHLVRAALHGSHERRASQLVRRQLVDVSHRLALKGLADELDVVALPRDL